ncbi:MAG: hypothetical protein C3F13_07240 [Anaerolineales bacterium]|nr:hypothetical protein [Anaerolineae bacterium]PWB54078.1 MAG: hypothetical protein C3F13_07240 [Anaerolineales bacterium]
MLILLTIFLFIFASFAMLILHLVRPRFSIQGFLAVLALLVGIVLISISQADIPTSITVLTWEPESLFPFSPSLLIDDISWFFAFGLTALSFCVLITSIANLGRSTKHDQPAAQNIVTVQEDTSSADKTHANNSDLAESTDQMPNWILWIVILIFTSMGLVAVTAGNLLTLMLAWAALDMLQLVTLLSQTPSSQVRERMLINFSARMVALVLLIIAALMQLAGGAGLSFENLPPSVSLLLIFAAGLRLGVLPPLLPFSYQIAIRHELETVLQLIPSAASLILLVRVASTGIPQDILPYILGFTIVVGLYASNKWLTQPDAAAGRNYWLLGISSLALSAAMLAQPSASLAWAIACLLSGGLVFCLDIRHRNLTPLLILGLFNISILPFSPTWQAASMYQAIGASNTGLVLTIIFSSFLILIQSLIFAGYFRHSWRGVYPNEESKAIHIEKWVWVLYPFGLMLILTTHLLIGWLILPDLRNLPLFSWFIGPLTLLVSATILFLLKRIRIPSRIVSNRLKSSNWNKLFSLEWLYLLIWQIYHAFSRVFGLVSTILEGDGGLLWALVLFALIFVFLQK